MFERAVVWEDVGRSLFAILVLTVLPRAVSLYMACTFGLVTLWCTYMGDVFGEFGDEAWGLPWSF